MGNGTEARGAGRDGGRRDQPRGGGRREGGGFQGAYVDPEKEKVFRALNIPVAMQRKVGLAMERNTRVILARSPYTHTLLDIVKQVDRATKNMNNRVLTMPDPQATIAIFARFKEATEAWDEAAAELCKAAGLDYISPVLDRGSRGGDNGGGKEAAQAKGRARK